MLQPLHLVPLEFAAGALLLLRWGQLYVGADTLLPQHSLPLHTAADALLLLCLPPLVLRRCVMLLTLGRKEFPVVSALLCWLSCSLWLGTAFPC